MFAKRVLDSSYMASKTLFLNLMTLARKRGCFRLSMPLPTGVAAGSVPMPSCRNCATSTTTTRTCGPGCWSYKPYQERQRRNSTAPRSSPTSMSCSGRRTAKLLSDRRHSRGLLVLLGIDSGFLLGIVNGFFSLVWVSLWLCQQCERRCVP